MKSLNLVAGCAIAMAMPAHAATHCAPKDPEAVANTVRAMFDAALHDDETKMRDVFAPGFYAFDGGRRFDGMALLDLIRQAHAAGKIYRWTVTKTDVHVDCDTAWIAYVDDGAVGDASGMKPQIWLESAMLRWERGKWRIMFLHSTRAAGS